MTAVFVLVELTLDEVEALRTVHASLDGAKDAAPTPRLHARNAHGAVEPEMWRDQLDLDNDGLRCAMRGVGYVSSWLIYEKELLP
jgi:hypothetical protein